MEVFPEARYEGEVSFFAIMSFGFLEEAFRFGIPFFLPIKLLILKNLFGGEYGESL